MVICRRVLVALVLIGCFCGSAVHAQTAIPLQEAVSSGLAIVEISGISISYQQPMVRIMISQVSDSTPPLVVSKGLVLTSEDPSFADVIIAHDSTVTLEPGEIKTLKLYAFSLDLTRSFPPPKVLYSIRGMSSDASLLTLLDRIEDQHAEGGLAAQLAVWMQVMGYSLDRIEKTLGVSLTKYHAATLSLLAPPPGGSQAMTAPVPNSGEAGTDSPDSAASQAEIPVPIIIIGGAILLLVASLGYLFWMRRSKSLSEAPSPAAPYQQVPVPPPSGEERCSGCGNPKSQCTCAGRPQPGLREPGSPFIVAAELESSEAKVVRSGPRLVAVEGDCAGQEYYLPPEGDCLLSRAELPFVTIALSTISAPHALIRLDKRPYRIKDLNSGNGTMVDGRRLPVLRKVPGQEQIALHDGSQVVLGDVAFTFEEAPPLLRDSQGNLYPLQAGARTIITRVSLPCCEIQDRTVSAPHALIRRDATYYTVRDLNSGNNTEVGIPVAEGFHFLSSDAPRNLRDGARLCLGHALLEMRDEPQPIHAGLPRRVDSYRIVGMVGVGGMAYVLDGRGPQGERVAVKIPKEVLAYDASFRERFERETNSMKRLEHPNIVRVLEVGQVKRGRHLVADMGLQYIVMSFIDGCSLSCLLADEQPLPDQISAEIVRHVAQALQHAHEKGVIHRDIKPSNILISRAGEILITDFGIARAQDEAPITQLGELLCSPQYVSPEHFTNKKIDERSDIYSLGVVLYQMLTGKVPFNGNAPPQTVLSRHQSEEPVPPREIRGDVPPELAAIALKCLAKEPGERFDSAEALLAELPSAESAAAILAHMVAAASDKQGKPQTCAQDR
jgi:hypothetical protein